MEDKKDHPLTILARRYPQLRLPICKGEKDTEEYQNVVLRGEDPERELTFTMNDRDVLETVETPAGGAEVMFLADREDFEHAARSLAYRCEPVDIPPSTGAMTIIGLINWEKIHAHEDDLDAFLADKNNYLDGVILLSDGSYSAVSGERFGFSEQEWKEKSKEIRKYHELTHFVSRKLFPENEEAVRDECIADMIGIISAFGFYDTEMARVFLGTEGDTYRAGGRLETYAGDEPIEDVMAEANRCINELDRYQKENQFSDIFALLKSVESNKIGKDYSEVKE